MNLPSLSSDVLSKSQIAYKDSREISVSKSGLTTDLAQLFQLLTLILKQYATWQGEMVPFQESITKVLMDHFEHLCSHEFDDRESLAAFLVEKLSGAKTIVAWNVTFERRMLEHLARVVPKYSESLRQIICKLVDLHEAFCIQR